MPRRRHSQRVAFPSARASAGGVAPLCTNPLSLIIPSVSIFALAAIVALVVIFAGFVLGYVALLALAASLGGNAAAWIAGAAVLAALFACVDLTGTNVQPQIPPWLKNMLPKTPPCGKACHFPCKNNTCACRGSNCVCNHVKCTCTKTSCTCVKKCTAMPRAAAGPRLIAEKIGLLEFDSFHVSDVQNWMNLLELPPVDLSGQLSAVPINGGVKTPGSGESEVLLDIDTVLSMDPWADYAVYEAPLGTTFEEMFNRMIGSHDTIISNSWAQCEDDTSPSEAKAIDSVLAQAEASGISVFNASGDSGSTCLDGSPNTVTVPADSPHGIAVGGTTPMFGPGMSYGGERWWGASTSSPPTGQGGFGVSRYFSVPTYQKGFTSAHGRSVPDVSINADPRAGLEHCQADAGGCPDGEIGGGTSMAAPEMAALTSKLEEIVQKNLHVEPPTLYQLASARAAAFHSPHALRSDFAHVGLGSPDLNQWQLQFTGAKVGPVSASASTAVGSAAATAGVPGAGVLRVSLSSTNGYPVGGKTVTVTAATGTHATVSRASGASNAVDGSVTFSVTDPVVENVKFTVRDATDGVTLATHPAILFAPPPATAGGIGATLETVPADGATSTTLTVTLRNGKGQPATGKTVSVDEGAGHAIITPAGKTPGVTDSRGEASFTVVDLTAETVTFTATDDTDGSLPVPGSAKVVFTSGSGANQCPAETPRAVKGFALHAFASGFFDGSLNHVTGCGGIGDLTWDSSGYVYVPDYITGDIYKFSLAGGSPNGIAKVTRAPLGAYLASLTFGKNGDLYAFQYFTPPGSTAQCGCIYQLDPSTGAIKRLVAQNVPATDIYADPISGDILTTSSFNGGPDYSNNVLRVHDPGPGKPVVSCAAPAPKTDCSIYAAIGGPTGGITFDRDGTLYVGGAWWTSANLWQVSATNSKTPGTIKLLYNAVVGGGASPVVLRPGSKGTLPVLAINSTVNGVDTVESLNLNQKHLTPTPLLTGGTYTRDLGPDGCLYLAGSNTISRLTTAGGSCPYPPAASQGVGISLAQSRTQGVTGGSVAFTAHISGVSSPAGTQVEFQVVGANGQARLLSVNGAGSGVFTYTGAQPGLDSVTAMATVDGKSLVSTTLFMRWHVGKHVTYTSLSTSPTSGLPGHKVRVTGSLTDLTSQPPKALGGQRLLFSLGRASCQATTSASGYASCTLALPSAAGGLVLRARFAGSRTFLPSSASTEFQVIGTPTYIAISGRAVQNSTDGDV